MVACCALLAASVYGARIESTGGAGDGLWSSPGNWSAGVPQSGDQVVLMDGGIIPTNVDVAGLALDYVMFSNIIQNVTLIGEDLQVNYIWSQNTNNFINNNIQMTASTAWRLRTGFTLTMNGVLGATNDTINLAANDSGALALRNTNTWAGGLKANQSTIVLYFDANLGKVPADYVANFIENGATKSFQSTGGFNRFVVHPNRGFRFNANNTFLLGPNTKVVINQPIIQDATARNLNFINSSAGVLELGGSNTFTGEVGNNTATWLVRLKHPWALGQGTPTVRLLTQGTFDVMGHSILSRTIRGVNGNGWPSPGCIMNSVDGTTCVISNGFYNSTNNGGWFGRGDFVVLGKLEYSSTGTTMPLKTGTGRLVLKSQVYLTNRVNMVNGTLVWDYRDEISDRLPDAHTLRLESAVLETIGNASAPVTETIGHLDVTATTPGGANALNIASALNQDFTLAVSNILLGRQSQVDFSPRPQGSATVKITTTNPGGLLTNGTLYFNVATYKQRTWAMVADGIVTGLPDAAYLTDLTTAGLNDHVDIAGAVNNNGSTAMTMRFTSPLPTTLTIADGKTLRAGIDNGNNGAILVAPGAGQVDINGGAIAFGNNTMFHIHQHNINAPLVIASRLGTGSNPGVAKCGPGEVILTNRTSSGGGDNGGFQIHEGVVTTDCITNNGVASSIGQGSSGTAISLGNGVLRYIGEGHASDRAILLRGDGTIEASGSGPLYFTRQNAFATQSGGGNFLTLGGTGTGIIDGVLLLGAGTVIKDGPGIWFLNGTNSIWYSDTHIKQGALVVNGDILRSVCNISGGALMGNGFVSEIVVQNGGTLAPGSSIGTLNTLALEFKEGSVYQWEVDETDADAVAVKGELVLPEAPNSVTVHVVRTGSVLPTDTNTLIKADQLIGDPDALVLTFGPGLSAGAIVVDGTDVKITGLIPEPGVLGLLALAGAVLRRR